MSRNLSWGVLNWNFRSLLSAIFCCLVLCRLFFSRLLLCRLLLSGLFLRSGNLVAVKILLSLDWGVSFGLLAFLSSSRLLDERLSLFLI